MYVVLHEEQQVDDRLSNPLLTSVIQTSVISPARQRSDSSFEWNESSTHLTTLKGEVGPLFGSPASALLVITFQQYPKIHSY
jgi:hypothetical protein